MTNKEKPVALVTGAAGGIGKAICDVFSISGYKVIGVDRHPNPGFSGNFINLDLTQLHMHSETSKLFYAKIEELSGGHLNALINNAAIQIVKPLNEINAEDWNITLNTNLLAPFWLTQKLSPLLHNAKGSVINVSSIHASLTKSHFCLYATSKGALVSLTRSLSIELSPNVRVNAILPAATDTDMLHNGFKDYTGEIQQLKKYHPLKRIAKPEEVAKVVLFLAGDSASFITGATINADGGIGACLHDPSVRY